MIRETQPPVASDDHTEIAKALLARKVMMHRINLRPAGVGSLCAAIVLVAMLWRDVDHTALLAWLALLATVLGGRMLFVRMPSVSPDAWDANRAWLFRCRAGFLAHGIAWGLCNALPLNSGDALHLAILMVVMAGVMASSFALTSFDLAASLLFVVPMAGMLSARLFAESDPTYWMLGIAVLGAALFLSVAASRAHRIVRKYEALRLAEASQADALRSSEHLLERTGATAGVGGWELDLATMGLRLTAQAYRIHDVTPVSRPTFDGFISLYGPAEQVHMRAGLEEVIAKGVSYDHELPLTTLRGRKIWVRLIGHPQFADGKVVGIDGVVQDITERRRVDQALRLAHEELAQQKQSLQDTLDSISQGIVSVDAAGHPRVHNRRALELLELPEHMLRPDVTYDEVVRFQMARGDLAPDGSFVDVDGERRYFKGGRAASPESYVRRTRSGVLLEVRTRQLPDGGLVRTYADVTAYIEVQRALRGSEAELRALLDAFPGFIAVMNANYTYSYVNHRFAALLGKQPEDIVGKPVREVLGDERFERLRAETTAARAGAQITTESEYPASAQRARTWLQVTHAIGLEDAAGRRNTYAFGLDVSARKEAEIALTAAKEEAERANLAKSQFLSSMSHELRTPMNAILGFGQLLVADVVHPLAEPQREYVREILRGGRHLLNLINEVLDLAQVETGKLRISLEPVRLSDLLQECLALLRPLAREDSIELILADPAACDSLVQADRTRLKQVLLNLLSNAIKYNRAGGLVHITCQVGTDDVRLAIRDDGPGLDPEQRGRLFQAFERLDAGDTPVEGAGLGLVLSKHLMNAMRGEIGVDSEVGQGSTFWIRLPRAAAPVFGLGAELPVAGERRAQRRPGPRKVLYIEDNPVNVLLMEAMLSRIEGLQFVTAPMPRIGLQMAVDEAPDLILLDIQLPEMDGYEVLRRLRLNEASRDIPVIAVSANAMPDDIAHGLAAGFVQYLTKPLDMQALIKAVELALAGP